MRLKKFFLVCAHTFYLIERVHCKAGDELVVVSDFTCISGDQFKKMDNKLPVMNQDTMSSKLY